MIINKSGVAIRLNVKDLRVMGRATQGVRLINLKGNDSIAAVAKVINEEDEEVVAAETDAVVTNETDETDETGDTLASDDNEE
jgi:DNA gyrase subunit A